MTVCAQVVADVFGLQPAQVVVNVEFDTAKDAWSVAAGNYSSRFAGAVAGTVHLAAQRLRDKLARIAARSSAARCSGCASRAAWSSMRRRPSAASPSRAWLPIRTGRRPCCPRAKRRGCARPPSGPRRPWPHPDAQDVNTSAAYGFVFDVCGLEVDPATGRVRRPLCHRATMPASCSTRRWPTARFAAPSPRDWAPR